MKEEKRSISIRVNGKACEPKETVTNNEDNLIPQPTNVIDFSKKQEERTWGRQPYWDDGNREKSPKIPFKRKKKTPLGLKQSKKFPFVLAAALCSAIVIGLSLGFMVLSIFTGDPVEMTDHGQGTNAVAPTSSNDGNKIGLPVLTVEVVQGGAFSSIEKGKEVVATLKSQNLAAVLLETENPIYLFIGVGQDREQAEKLNEIYVQKGYETYLKTYTIDGEVVAGQAGEANAWFERAFKEYNTLLQMTNAQLQGNEDEIDEEIAQVEKGLAILAVEQDKAWKQLPDDAKVHAQALVDALTSAKNELIKTKQTESNDVLWQSEQALLDVLIHYERMINSMVNVKSDEQ